MTYNSAMSNDAASDLHFGIDRLVVRGPRVFGWGWIADRRRIVKEVHLLFGGARPRRRLAANIGLARNDVAEAFPGLAAARASGFVVTGYVAGAAAANVAMEVRFDDGSDATLDIGPFAEIAKTGRGHGAFLPRIARSLRRRLKTLDFSGLLSGPGGRRFGVRSLDERRAGGRLREALRLAGRVRVIFDHSMGGGANEYRRRAIAKWLEASDAVLFVTYNLPTLDYRVHLFVRGAVEQEFRATSFLALEGALQDAPVAELFVNSPVSFDEPALFAEWLVRMRGERPDARLTMTLHDYFAVCPSFVLLDADGRYCGVPDIDACERCLQRHAAAHVAFSPPTSARDWRRAWGECLQAADEVRCFSRASRDLLLRAYPQLDRATTTVVPHAMEFWPARAPALPRRGPLVIGIVGQISFQKGGQLVAELLERIEREHPEARVVVVGTLELPVKSERLTVIGPYRREDLAATIEAHRINLFLFPSIWPETFSYVLGEMMALRLPIVAFELGAPAERLRTYSLGRLCGEVSAEAALKALVAFHRELAAGEAAAA